MGMFTTYERPIRILTVEDHPVFREGLSVVIGTQPDMVLVAEASNAIEGVAEFRRHKPDVTLMDVRLPVESGIDALATIIGDFPNARIVMLSYSACDGEIQRALKAGAAAYVLKSMPQKELFAAIRAVHVGRTHMHPEVAARLTEHLGKSDPTRRQLEVLDLVKDGLRNKEIASELGISEATVNYHIKHLGDKLGANDKAHAVAIALRRGLLSL
jgi:DNA-binding NarL/FixJ family response regulator